MLFRTVIPLSILFYFFQTSASNVIEVNDTWESPKKQRALARQDMVKKASQEISESYVKSLMGEEKFLKNKSFIKSSILDQSGRFILYTKGSHLERTESGYKMDIHMKLSLKNLRELLLAKGLLYDLSSPPKVLPLIQFTNNLKNNSFSWWFNAKADPELKLLSQKIHKEIFNQLKPLGFFTLLPNERRLYHSLPNEFQSNSLSLKDVLFLGRFLKAEIVLSGDIQVTQAEYQIYKMDIKISALQTNNGREIASITRSFTSKRGEFEMVFPKLLKTAQTKLSGAIQLQLKQVWSRGTFGSHLYRVYFKGNFKHSKLKELKENLRQISHIRSFRERSSSKTEVSFEVDSLVDIKQVAQNISNHENFKSFQLNRIDNHRIFFEL